MRSGEYDRPDLAFFYAVMAFLALCALIAPVGWLFAFYMWRGMGMPLRHAALAFVLFSLIDAVALLPLIL